MKKPSLLILSHPPPSYLAGALCSGLFTQAAGLEVTPEQTWSWPSSGTDGAQSPNRLWETVHVWAAVLYIYETLMLCFPDGSYTGLELFFKRTLFLLFDKRNYEKDFKPP